MWKNAKLLESKMDKEFDIIIDCKKCASMINAPSHLLLLYTYLMSVGEIIQDSCLNTLYCSFSDIFERFQMKKNYTRSRNWDMLQIVTTKKNPLK